MKTRIIFLSSRNVVLFYGGLGFLGSILLRTQRFMPILIGFFLILLSIHELGHIWALRERGYQIKGLILTILGPGVYQDRQVEFKDSTLVFLSGFSSLIIPILIFIVFPNLTVFYILFTSACILSAVDVYYWLEIRKEAGSKKSSA